MTDVSARRPPDSSIGEQPAAPERDWLVDLATPGPIREVALADLHRLLLRASRFQVSRMRAMSAAAGAARAEDMAQAAADEALVQVLRRLDSFEGRSRFTTWAYKFAVLQAAVEMRRHTWLGRDVPLETAAPSPATGPSPEQYAEAADLARAAQAAIDQALTPHQRRILLALVVDEVPIDVLAERLGTTRNALYKTLHDARCRVRARLITQGYLPPTATKEAGLP